MAGFLCAADAGVIKITIFAGSAYIVGAPHWRCASRVLGNDCEIVGTRGLEVPGVIDKRLSVKDTWASF